MDFYNYILTENLINKQEEIKRRDESINEKNGKYNN